MRRAFRIWWALVLLLATVCVASPALSLKLEPEEVGRWRFKQADRPVKVVALGGSVTAWPVSFGRFLQAACSRIEVVNRAKAAIGGAVLRERFIKQVLRNRRVKPAAYEEMWLMFQGGLNSIGMPRRTNRQVASIFRKAHEAGIKTLGLSLGPWGKPKWKIGKALRAHQRTRVAVDYMMGRLRPRQALGRWMGKRSERWEPGEIPDIAIDLYDSPLRAKKAALRDEEKTRVQLKRSRWFRELLKAQPEEEREAFLEEHVALAREVPRYFMRKDLQAFDHIHPNTEGHRVIAQLTCPSLPTSWGCECEKLSSLVWQRAKRKFTVDKARANAQP